MITGHVQNRNFYRLICEIVIEVDPRLAQGCYVISNALRQPQSALNKLRIYFPCQFQWIFRTYDMEDAIVYNIYYVFISQIVVS